MRENCGLYGGVYPRIASEIYRGLLALQHRGQESAGISLVHNCRLSTWKNPGLVREALPLSKVQVLKGDLGIGHVRYSTAGGTDPINAQPIEVEFMKAKVALAHNGNLENYQKLRREMEQRGKVFLTSSDSEIFLQRLVEHFRSPPSSWDPLEMARVVFQIQGAYSLLFLFENKVVAIRDPKGYRPLWIRRQGNTVLFSSEDAALSRGRGKAGNGTRIFGCGYRGQLFLSEAGCAPTSAVRFRIHLFCPSRFLRFWAQRI